MGKRFCQRCFKVVDTNKVSRELLEDNMVMVEMEKEFSLVGEENVLKTEGSVQ